MEPLEKNKKNKIDQADEDIAYVRLNKFIADAGICSRRNAETLIKEGRIEVNGKVMTELGYKVDVKNDWVKLDKKRIQPKNAHEDLVYAFNKPKRCVSTLFDPEGRETLLKYIPKNFPRLFPVGRLDYDTEGLLLLTNAGRLANQIAHPSGEVWKTYLVKIKGSLTDQEQAEIKKGPVLRGEKTLPTVLKVLTEEDGKSWLELKLREGKNHQIKQIFFKLYKPVLKIKRVQVGSVKLGNLKLGEIRRLTKEELKTLKEVAGKKASLKVSKEEKLAKHEQHKKRVKAERPYDRDDL